jgi:hypothetical protein
MYSVSGRWRAGEARGRALGFPTINVLPESERKLLPPDGVYAVYVETPRGGFGGMLNLGGRPDLRRRAAHDRSAPLRRIRRLLWLRGAGGIRRSACATQNDSIPLLI